MKKPQSGIGATNEHTKLIMDSYRRWTGKELVKPNLAADMAESLFLCPAIVLSHGTEPDPILNYGNLAALHLWEMDWETFTITPSRLTAEPMERSERELFLKEVNTNGFIDQYTGIRISSKGKRFYIEKAIVWNLMDDNGKYHGQAAAFSEYRYCD